MKADGSVIIDTKIIDGGLKKGFDLLKNQMSSVGVDIENLGDKIKLTFSDKTTVAIENAVINVQRLERELNNITQELSDAKLSGNDAAAEKWGNRQIAVYDRLEKARRRLAQVIVNEAQKEANKETREARRVAAEKERQYARATKGAKAFGKRLTSIVSSALVFNLVSRGLRSVTEYFGKALKTNKQFTETASKLKGALLTAFQPLYETLLPGVITAMQVIAKYALMIGEFFASITGKNSATIKENAEALYEQANATEETAKAAKDAKKALAGFDEINTLQNKSTEDETKSTNANFNLKTIDLNSKLSEMAKLASEALLAVGLILLLSGADIPLGLGMTVGGALGIYKSIEENWGGINSNVLSTAEAIAFLSSTLTLAIGIIITCCCPQHLSLGLSMIIAGLAGQVTEVATNWNAIKESLQNPLTAAVALFAGAVLLVVGIFCLFAQRWVLGISLIVEGAAFIALTIAANWNAIKEKLQNPLLAAAALFAGTVLLVLGIFCLFAQRWILGIGLLVAGAAVLGYTAALNWNAIKEALQGPIGAVVALISGVLLVLGVLLCFTGVGIPLGIGLIAAGAVGLATVVALNWAAIVTKVKEIAGGINDWIQSHGFAMMILGIILLFTGVAIPIGLALIGLGVKGMVTGKDPLWNIILEKIKECWQSIKNFWNSHIAKVFTGQFWLDLAKKCGNGLIGGFESAINGIISMFESMINWIVKGLNKISFDVPDWVPGIGGKKFGFNIPEVKFSRVSIPRLAQGAVIPPGREFLAILGDQKNGTNVEAPLDTIKQALAEVLELQGGAGETVVTVNFTGDLAQLARVLKPAIETETRRKGGSLVRGGAF